MNAFVKDYWKSFLLGGLGALVLICVGLPVYDRLTLDTPQERTDLDTHSTAIPPPSTDVRNRPPVLTPQIKRVRTKTTPHQNRSPDNIGSILPITSPDSPPLLPTEIQTRLNRIYREMVIAGTMYEIRNGEKVITEAAYMRRFEILVGGMSTEDAVAFLETYQIYNPIILDELEPRRAIDYLYKVRARWQEKEAYARSVLARDSSNPDAQMVLLSAEQDDTVAAAGYRDIVSRYPDDIGALNALGYRLHYDHPMEAIQYLKMANNLDSSVGYFNLGMAYERLGDLKTAWLYYGKQQTIQNGDLVELHKDAIEMGEPLYKSIYATILPIQETDEVSLDTATSSQEELSVPAVEETPWLPDISSKEHNLSDNQLTDKGRQYAARAEAARAAFERQQSEFQRRQAAAQQEFEEFLKWAESIMNGEESIEPEDFLTKEFAAHLKGGKTRYSPERTIRAYEMIERYGPEEGLRRLKEKDAELAEEIELHIKSK